MANEKAEKTEKKVLVYNGSQSVYQIHSGFLRPGEKLEVTQKEWQDLKGYPQLLDTSVSSIPEGKDYKTIAKKLAKAEKENVELKATVAKLTADLDELTKPPKK